ncbi:hypothetical protein HYFRA_00002966 [Hymenoscyphus fraxineus]|uniref:Uncharacterized protein n=1 Tax=Hymenoscyphus fraxineus TaxID=746836 RepID=A0A9N9PPL1_9HELO|nr:hypothetical protein HYFRA_00002966 [Hymenoscyphus fraxineus]
MTPHSDGHSQQYISVHSSHLATRPYTIKSLTRTKKGVESTLKPLLKSPCLRFRFTGGTDNPAIELFLRLKDGGNSKSDPPKETIVIKSIEYSYRYLLSTGIGLQAYWRYRQKQQTLLATRNKNWQLSEPIGLPAPDPNGDQRHVAIGPKERDLFEQQNAQDTAKTRINGTPPFKAYDASSMIIGLPPQNGLCWSTSSLTIVCKISSCPTPAIPSSSVGMVEEKKVSWSGEIIADPSSASEEYNVAMLVTQSDWRSTPELEENGFIPESNVPDDNLQKKSQFHNRLYFGDVNLHIPSNNWFRRILMDRFAAESQYRIPTRLALAPEAMCWEASKMNEDQLEAVFHTLETNFTNTIGPPRPGTGNSFVIAAFKNVIKRILDGAMKGVDDELGQEVYGHLQSTLEEMGTKSKRRSPDSPLWRNLKF